MNGDEHTMLARIDERTKNIEREVSDIKKKFMDYTLLARFSPVEKLVYGLVALVMAGLVGAILSQVLK